jgi:ABC-type polysaccharide/polyol phosphate transport system ATPase subunit
MSEVVILAEGLGKKYLIGHQSARDQDLLGEAIGRMARGFARNTMDMLRGRPLVSGDEVEEFWALKDINFDIRRADVVGIVGRNGAGKSTLLKILSRITEPTEGRVTICDRIASLLEVGTGFHLELTGRENIYLNGAILGLSRSEIRRKFDEIVAFAEIDRFLDTPVKRYSSGMYVRLAFAVAAHLEPEILIVDEVLAVGDASFQEKCLGKMRDVSRQEGRTVLFVTHNMAAVKALCQKGIMLDQGRIVCFGTADEAVDRYVCGGEVGVHDGVIPDNLPRLYSTDDGRLRSVHLLDASGDPVQTLVTGELMQIRVEWDVFRALPSAMIEIGIMDSEGRQITQSLSCHENGVPAAMPVGRHQIDLLIDQVIFPGRYSILAGLHKEDGTSVDWVERALDFEVFNTGRGNANHYHWGVRGYLRPRQKWQQPASYAHQAQHVSNISPIHDRK